MRGHAAGLLPTHFHCGGSKLPRIHGKAEIMSIKPIQGSNGFFELAREMKYANKQIDKMRRELAQ